MLRVLPDATAVAILSSHAWPRMLRYHTADATDTDAVTDTLTDSAVLVQLQQGLSRPGVVGGRKGGGVGGQGVMSKHG